MAVDVLFAHIEKLQAKRPWGSLLDAGTGKHSLAWIQGLATTTWTGVTGDELVAGKLRRKFANSMRSGDTIVSGNWTDPALLHGQVFDVVVADYLLGAVEAFARYFQDRPFVRLRPHVGGQLYVVGLQPYPLEANHPWGKTIVDIARLRDACILLAGHSTYREYPLEWSLRHLAAAGFRVEDVECFPIHFGPSFVKNQLRVAERKLLLLTDRALAESLQRSLEELRERALDACNTYQGTPFSEDYVIHATPA